MILDGVRQVISTYQPDQVAVEIVFVNVNPQSTLLLGQARARRSAAGAVSHDLPVAEIHRAAGQAGGGRPRQGRQGAGLPHGRAPAGPRGEPSPDAADALACAICHAHGSTGLAALAGVGTSKRAAG